MLISAYRAASVGPFGSIRLEMIVDHTAQLLTKLHGRGINSSPQNRRRFWQKSVNENFKICIPTLPYLVLLHLETADKAEIDV